MVVWILISSLVINVAFYYCCIREAKDDNIPCTDDTPEEYPEIVIDKVGTPLSVTPGDSATSSPISRDSPDTLSPDFVLVEDEAEETEEALSLFTKDLIQAPKTQ